MTESTKRVIVIGSEGHYGVKTTSWESEDIPNVADYDAVILETASLASILNQSSKEQNKDSLQVIDHNLDTIRNMLLEVLHSKGSIYAICSPEVRARYGTTPWGHISNYEWSPIPVNLSKEAGQTIQLVDESFSHYFQFVKSWAFCFEGLESGTLFLENVTQYYGGRYYVRSVIEIIAKNRYEKPIAIRIGYTLHEPVKLSPTSVALARATGWDTPKYDQEIQLTSGSIVLLPITTEINSREAINLLLEDLYQIQQVTPPPEGIDDISMPNEDLLSQEIEERRVKIQSLSDEIGDLEKRKRGLDKFKQLLYETGKPLEDICKLVLQELGGKTDAFAEDFLLISGDREAVIEVKGREGVIERKDGAQLSQNRKNCAISKGKETRAFKAILLANAWRLIFPIGDRYKKDYFAPRLIKDAENDEMALVTTPELFDAYCKFLEGKATGEEIINRMFSGVGVTHLME
jgi:hypothetical protein